jgi:hypothetical protein
VALPTPKQTCPSANANATGDFLFFFMVLSSPQKGWRDGEGARAAATRQEKRYKCRYEAEYFTDVPIGCILNR